MRILCNKGYSGCFVELCIGPVGLGKNGGWEIKEKGNRVRGAEPYRGEEAN